MDIHRIYRPILAHFRRGRMQRFARIFKPTESTTILDVGGGPSIWQLLPVKPKLTIIDPYIESRSYDGLATYVRGDGCKMDIPDKSFDIVFSNSVIEHVGDRERQRQFAAECMRCGRGFYVQTPNKWFPVDPHTFMPFAHWLPKRVFNKLMHISPRFLITRPTASEMQDFVDMRLLSARDLQELFPRAEIVKERFMGITKSLIAVSRRQQP
jgi:SAM-dependent methyltransferase